MLPRSSSEFSALRGRRHSVTPSSLCRPMGFHGTGAASIGALQTGNIRMRVRIFMDPVASIVEERVNRWLEHEAGSAQIVKTETAVAAAAPGNDGRSHPYVVVTIWLEP